MADRAENWGKQDKNKICMNIPYGKLILYNLI